MTIRVHLKAFTLVELLVVIGILGILFSIGSYTVTSVSGRSRNDTRKQDLKHIQTALEQYATDQRSYPTLDTTLVANGKPAFSAVWQLNSTPTCAHAVVTAKSLSPNYLLTIPEDPQQSVNLAKQSCNNIVSNQNTRYLYITNTAGSTGSATTYGLMTTLERETVGNALLINGNLSTNAPYQYTDNPFAKTNTVFGPFYNGYTNTNVNPNYILSGGATR